MTNIKTSIKESLSEVAYAAGTASAAIVGTAIVAPFFLYDKFKHRLPRTNPLILANSLNFVKKQLAQVDEVELHRSSWESAWNDSSLITSSKPDTIIENYNSDLTHNRETLLRAGINLARLQNDLLLAEEFNSQLEELRQTRLNLSRWKYEGEVRADLHNHFNTLHTMDGLLDKILYKVSRSRMSPAVIGVIDFNNFGEESRFAQLEKQAGERAYHFGNALYFPIQDVLLVKGQEVPTKEGHLLVLGLDRDQFLKPGRSLDDSLKEARDYNGITIVDHPFSPHHGLGPFLMKNPSYLNRFDAWEIFNSEAALFPGANKKAEDVYRKEISRDYGVGALSGTDGHSIYEIGKGSTSILMPSYNSFKSSTDLSNALRKAVKNSLVGLGIGRNHTKRPARIGTLDHIADLATFIAFSKVRKKR